MSLRRALHQERWRLPLAAARLGRRVVLHGPTRPLLLGVHEQGDAAVGADPAPTSRLVHVDDAPGAAPALRCDGARAGLRLTHDAHRELLDAFRADPARQLIDLERRSDVAHDLLHDRVLLDVAGAYFRRPPHPLGVSMTLALPGLDPPPGFHYETTDLRALIAYFYLLGPRDGSGGHDVVLRSHDRKRWRELRSLHPRDGVATDGPGRCVLHLPLEPGTGWFEDPAALHRRLPASAPRLLVTVAYGMRRTSIEGSCSHQRVELPDEVRGLVESVGAP